MSRVAVMQPYFVPYAGYFRLFAAADTFVLLDSVQFPRRGWVHRNRIHDRKGGRSWLTLPLEKGPRQMCIDELRFTSDVADRLGAQLRRFPVFERPGVLDHPLMLSLMQLVGSPVNYVERLLRDCCMAMGLPFNVVRASELGGLEGLRRQDLILAIVERCGAKEYVNLSGGRDLYDARDFKKRGIRLRCLEDYRGPTDSILGRLLSGPSSPIRDEILASA